MNVLVVDKSNEFANRLNDFLNESSRNSTVIYYENYSNFTLSEKRNTFDLSFVSLDSCSLNEISLISKFSDVIGISQNYKSTRKYINNPIFKRIFQKPIDLVAIIKYLDNYCESGFIDKNLSVSILDLLGKIGFTINNNGTIYLAECIVEAKKNYFLKLVDVAEHVAKMNNTTTNNVIWAIRNSINRTINIIGEEKLEKYFKLYDGRRPTPKFLIDYFANII